MTPYQREHRFRRLKEIGCIACWIENVTWVYPEIHHLNGGGHAGQKRRGDEFTIPLCVWHHQGKAPAMPGPSLKNSRAFRARYGSDDWLLEQANNSIRYRDEIAKGLLPEAPVNP